MPRTLLLIALLLAPMTADAQKNRAPDMHIRMRGFQFRVNLDTLIFWESMPASAAMTFRATVSVLDSLKIKATYVDSVAGLIYHHGFVARVRLGGTKLSQFFRCGSGPSGEHADNWRLSIAYAIHVRPDGRQSRLGLATVAGAQDIDGTSKSPVMCGSTGGLLKLLSEKVEQKLVQ